ncbi:MAG TPA: hypothetical protein VFL55_18980 [Acetobacteraceae bacterium]|nr:hypothetical protein [Acetobacteraceae bacterium]
MNHSADKYARLGGFYTTNPAESFFALGMWPVPPHQRGNLAEADYQYNHRVAPGYGGADRAAALPRGTKASDRCIEA